MTHEADSEGRSSAARPTGLEGNGVGLVREIALASRVQRGLERLYQLDSGAPVDDFVSLADDGERETLFLRESGDGLELLLRLPRLADELLAFESDALDPVCQIIEGVSHFVYIAHRASSDREATQLELEFQAEVDKYVVLASQIRDFDSRKSRRLRERLYEDIDFVHDVGTERGDRYRLANELARRFVQRLERDYVTAARFGDLRGELRRFFHMSQSAKLRAA